MKVRVFVHILYKRRGKWKLKNLIVTIKKINGGEIQGCAGGKTGAGERIFPMIRRKTALRQKDENSGDKRI